MPTYDVQKARPTPDNIEEFVRIPRRREVFLETVALGVTTVLLALNTILSLYSWWGDSRALALGRGTRERLTEDFSSTSLSPSAWVYSGWITVFAAQFSWLGHAWSYSCRQKVTRASSPILYPLFCVANLANVGYIYAVGHLAVQLSLALICIVALSLCVSVGVAAASLRRRETGLADVKPVDKWSTRLLQINALSLYASWSVILVLFHLAAVLREDTSLQRDTIATCALSLLSAITVGYFLTESTILDRYLRWSVVVYPTVAWWVGGVLSRHWDGEFSGISRNNLFAFVFLVVACTLTVTRLVLVGLFVRFRSLAGGGAREDIAGIAFIPY